MMNHMGLTPYESFKVSEMSSRRPSGTAVAGLVLGTVGAALGVGAWIFAPIFSNAKANGIRDLANAQFQANNAQIASLANLLGTERAERVAQGVTMTQTITDSIAGTQSGSQSQSQTTAIDNTIQQIMQQTFSDAVTGRSSLNATPVQIYSAPQPCGCPGCGA